MGMRVINNPLGVHDGTSQRRAFFYYANIGLLPPTVTPALGDYINTITPSFLTPAQNTANIVKAAIKSTWKVDIDPGKARIATFNYQIGEAKPADGKLLNSITLTDAALKNMREKNSEDESLNGSSPLPKRRQSRR
ncbi:MAG TPA: hypothetical protein ENI30_03610 [Gammaproteobacteria bacterium]|nr:hypothetical protein [Gammaproteobacteria bacterium]